MIVSSLFRSHDTETPRAIRRAAALGWVLLLSTGIIAARDSLEWMGVQDYIRKGWGSTSYAPAWETLEPTMGAECRIGSHIRIMDDEFWPYAAGIFLQLEKNGRAASADHGWWFMFGRDGATGSRTPDCLTVLGRGVDAERSPGSNLVASLETKDGPLDIRLYSAAGNAVSSVLAVDHGDFDHLIEAGFYEFEPDEHGGSRWSSGRRSVFNVFLRTGVAYRIEFEAQAFNVPGMHQVASVSINNSPLGKLKISSSWDTYAVSIPRSAVRDLNRVAIEYAYAESPMALGRSNDRRTLAVRYRVFRFIAVDDRG
jgi:hypothetical protein